MANIPLMCPPLPTQRAIADFLDRKTATIDALIDKKERLIALLAEKRAALIHRAVTKGLDPDVEMKDSGVEWIGEIPKHWQTKKVSRFTALFRGRFSHRPRNDPRLYGGPFPFLQTGSIARSGKYIDTYEQTLNELGRATSTEFPRGTLVMAIAANVADVAVTKFPACFPDSVVGFRPNKETSVDYLYVLFTAMRKELVESATENTQKNLNIELVGALHAPVPPLNEQKSILDRLESEAGNTADITRHLRGQIGKLREYRQALITAAVTGQLDIPGACE